ncbi:oxidoreductase [Mycobacterium sp. ENV421]|uniref:PDR/VanB family oxidoreductase n=1 Tax=Mycobacterium sp. ENV421 TaxID=1213407 RepID=UPI000C9C57A2|nr:PDR/VanB family oxidoreductase [Mycobacterium sp. ENV421]PND58503.1 oxidoreductase [Mycobacterium sp. ENV421]
MRDRLGSAPPSASGRTRHDPLLRLTDASIRALWAISGAVRRPAMPQARERTFTLQVVDRRVVARDQNVVALTLAMPDRRPLPAWHPGAHVDIRLPSGRIRQYSLCGDPAAPTSYRIAVRRIPDGGGGSIEVHDDLEVGATVTTGGPRNAFPLTVPGYGSPARQLRFIAGGIGITPILPMLGLAQRLGIDWSMIYTGRSLESIPFLDELGEFGERVQIRTDDEHGIPTAAELLGACPDGAGVYTCGPAPMLTAIREALAGRDNVELHFERFAAPPVVDGTTFTATVASTGVTVAVQPEQTLLSALQREHVAAPYSCQQGFCGTCRTRVINGVVQHRDTLLTEPERAEGMMLTCVSRAPDGGHLTLDL